MPFTEIGRITGSGTLTTGATGTFNLTLSTAPASGTGVVAAYYTNNQLSHLWDNWVDTN